MGWNAMCGAGRTESICDGLVLEVGKRKGDSRREAQCRALRLVLFLTPTRLGGRGARGRRRDGELGLENVDCSVPVGTKGRQPISNLTCVSQTQELGHGDSYRI